MARPKSIDKRNAILDAAIKLAGKNSFWNTPTSSISRAAGIAEGTLFTYFKTKDQLANELYRSIKLEMAEVCLTDFPMQASLREKVLHFWNCYTGWGFENPDKKSLLAELCLSDKISDETRKVCHAAFRGLEVTLSEGLQKQKKQLYPVEFLYAVMSELSDVTIAFMRKNPRSKKRFCRLGFEMFWNSLGTWNSLVCKS